MDAIAKDLNALQDPDRMRRKRAFEKLWKLAQEPSCGELTREEQFQMLKSVLRGFEDAVEQCREHALLIVSELMPRQPVEVLDWVLPSIVARIGLEPVTEPSEELRVALLKLALLCLDVFPHDIGPRNYLDFYRVLLENCLKDSNPELKKLACVGCQKLCGIEPKRVKHLAVPLAKVVKNMCLQHKHFTVRELAVRTFGTLLSHGAVELLGDMKDEQDNRTTVHYLFVLVCDDQELVRMSVIAFLSQMLLDIPERGEQHRRLIPMVLVMLTDAHEAVRLAANSLLLKLGKLYLLDNEDNTTNLEKRRITMKDIEWYGDDAYPDMSLVTKTTLPLPDLNIRPHLGARYVVAEIVRNVLDKVLVDCLAMDWNIPHSKHNRRVVALRCLVMIIYFSESNIVQFAQQILAALYKAIKDDDVVVRTEAMTCVEMLGKFLTPDQYLPFIVAAPKADSAHADPEVEGDVRFEKTKTKSVTVVSASESHSVHQHLPTLFSTAPQSTKSSILVAFKYILLGSKDSLTPTQAKQVVRALTHPDLLDLEAPELLLSLVDAADAFAGVLAARGFIAPLPENVRCDDRQRTLDSMLLYLLLQVKACPDAAVVRAADQAVAKLSIATTGDAASIFTVHFGRLLRWHDTTTMPVCAFSDLVMKATNVECYAPQLVSMFERVLSDVNFSLRVTSELAYFTLLEGLLRGHRVAFDGDQLEHLLRNVILHHGAFRPGATAHLFRKVAVGALSASLSHYHRSRMMDQLSAENGALAEKCVSMWLNAMDADDADMRLACISCLADVVQLPMSDGCADDAWKHIMLRFDDSNDLLRLEVATQLHKALLDAHLMAPQLRREVRTKLDSTTKKLLIYMDDQDEHRGIKEIIAECLKQLCRDEDLRDGVMHAVQGALKKHHTDRFCRDVMQFASGLT